MTTLTREELREQANLIESLTGVMDAINDVSCVEFEQGDETVLDITISDRTPRKAPVTFAHAIPHDVLLLGLRVMRDALEHKVKEAA